jgi:hypothetical protein
MLMLKLMQVQTQVLKLMLKHMGRHLTRRARMITDP